MSVDAGFLIEALIKIIIVFHVVLIILAYTVLAERRVLAVIQNRLGPNRVGPFGLLQPFADLLKFIMKEELIPLAVNKYLYLLAQLRGDQISRVHYGLYTGLFPGLGRPARSCRT